MDKAERHRADKDIDGIVERGEETRKLAPALGLAEDAADLHERITEEAAGYRAHYKGRDAAVEQQLAERQRARPRLHLLHCYHRREDHYDAVAHIRHHEPVEQDEKRSHERVRVQTAVGRQAVHVRHHIERVGDFVILELYGDVGVFVLLGDERFPSAAEAFEHFIELRFALLGVPALHDNGAVRAVELVPGLGQRYLHAHAVCRKLQLVAPDGFADDVLHTVFLFGCERLKLGVRLGAAFLCRGADAREGRRAEAEAAQAFLHFGKLFAHAHEYDVVLLLLLMHTEELALGVYLLECRLYLTQLRAGGYGAEQHRAAFCALGTERQVEIEPRLERLDDAALAALLGADALDARVVALDAFGDLERTGKAGIVQQDAVVKLRLCGEKLALLRGIMIQQVNGMRQRCVPALERCDIAALPMYQRFDIRAVKLALKLGNFHAAMPDKLSQEFFLIGTDSNKAELFHF